MVKTYISVLELLSGVIDVMRQPDAPHLTIPIMGEIDAARGMFTIVEDMPEENPGAETKAAGRGAELVVEPHPLDLYRQEQYLKGLPVQEAGDGQKETEPAKKKTRTVQTNIRVWDEVPPHMEFEVPYFLEMEFLKKAGRPSMGLPFCEREWDLIEQMLILFVGIWMVYTGKIRSFYEMGHLVAKDAWMVRLRLDGLLRDLDVEEEPEQVEGIIKEVYGYASFPVLGSVFGNLYANHRHKFVAAPISSKNAFEILKKIYEDEFGSDKSNIYNRFLLFAPWILIFFFLECETEELKAYTYYDYQNYKKNFEIYAMVPAKDCEHFSYGYYTRYRDTVDDTAFVSKIIRYIKMRMDGIVSKNISTVSVNESSALSNWSMDRVSVLLNKTNLTWKENQADE